MFSKKGFLSKQMECTWGFSPLFNKGSYYLSENKSKDTTNYMSKLFENEQHQNFAYTWNQTLIHGQE